MDVTKPYKFIGFGLMDVTKPYKFIGFVFEVCFCLDDFSPGLEGRVGDQLGHP